MDEIPYIDFHTHSYRAEDATIEVVSIHPGRKTASDLHTLGYHPWWTMERLSFEQEDFLSNSYLNDATCLAIGECGLDKLKGPSIAIQEEVFVAQILLANKLQAPLIVHCVRQYDKLIQIHKSMAKTDWVVHGFMRNQHLAKSLLDQGMYLSCAPYVSMKTSFMDTLIYVPLDRIFLETDSETSHTISERYHIFAKLRELSLEEIRATLFNNFSKLFNKKWQYHIG